MRIISGEYRGRKLNTPKKEAIRPTTDKVKEAVFNMIAPYVSNAVVCDLFAGTGNLGLEALSQGASKCYFCDRASESIRIINENIEKCNAADKSEILRGDFEKNLDSINEKVDIFFIDPPYEKTDYYEKSIVKILGRNLLSKYGIIIFEHEVKCKVDEFLVPIIAGSPEHNLTLIKRKKYGTIMISIFVKQI